jgi:hypothetical protein
MPDDADATECYALGSDRRTDSQPYCHTDPDPDGEKRSDGPYVVVDTVTREQHARGLPKARAESLAAELADGIVARRERADPHWLQRVGGGAA